MTSSASTIPTSTTLTSDPSETDAPSQAPDPRASLARAQQWIAELLAAVTPDQLSRPTPCTEMDVARLVGHLYGVAGRAEVMGHGHPAASAPAFVDELPGDLAAGYRERTARAQAAWTDDASLTRTVVAPFGPMPGADVLGVYLSEHLAHGWDLAMATGQPSEVDPALVAQAQQAITAILPPEPRGGPIPFGPVVAPTPSDGPLAQLARYLGRSWPTV